VISDGMCHGDMPIHKIIERSLSEVGVVAKCKVFYCLFALIEVVELVTPNSK